MFHFSSDFIADQSLTAPTDSDYPSLNLIQVEHPKAIPPSPENPPPSSPASLSCSTSSSPKAWRSASEQVQTPIFSFPDPICHNFSAIPSDEPSDQRISYVQMSAFDTPSFQEPAISAVDEGEVEDLRWTTGVPCHMMDVFRANPFAAMGLPRTTSTTSPLDNSECRGLHRARSTAKHTLTPDAVEQKRKCRTKRARIQSPPVLPFPATGPQEMFAYEFKVDVPYESNGFSRPEDFQRCGDLPPSYSLSRVMDSRDLLVPRPVMAYSSEDASVRLPVDHEDVGLFRLTYPCSHAVWIPQNTRSEHRMQTSHHPFSRSVPLSNQRSRFGDPSNSAASTSRQEIDGIRPRFEEHGCSSLPPAVPMQVMPETYRLSVTPATPSTQKPLYACPLCPRDFQLPNGLALHLKWHDRVGNLTKNSTSYLSHRPHGRITPKAHRVEPGQLDARDLNLTQLPTQYNNQRGTNSGLPSTSYTVPQGVNSAQAEYMTSSNHGQYPASYERQPQECALFRDVLQLNHNANSNYSLDNNAYLAPLDGLSVLQPLPFEQCHSSTGKSCPRPPP